MKSRKKKQDGYACSRCGRFFPCRSGKAKHGQNEPYAIPSYAKACADACCSCSTCGQKNDRYMGTADKRCTACKNKDEREMTVQNLTRALDNYERVSRDQRWHDPATEGRIIEHAKKHVRGY